VVSGALDIIDLAYYIACRGAMGTRTALLNVDANSSFGDVIFGLRLLLCFAQPHLEFIMSCAKLPTASKLLGS
jgi:hypothetical protein